MKLAPLIARIKTEAAILSGRVGGLGELAAAVEASTDFALPHAFVVRLEEAVQPSTTTSPPQQPIEEKFGVVVCVSNEDDPRGQSADDQLDDVRAELLAALKGWAPADDRSPMEYRGFANLEMSRACMWRRFNFSSLTGDI